MASTSKQMTQKFGKTTATTTTVLNDNGCQMIPANGPFGNKTIGPRTVIVPADPLEWNEGTTYEYLTLVLAESGNSYISKRDVPAGTPVTNTEYWIKSSDWNAQLANIENNLNKVVLGNIGFITAYGADPTGMQDISQAFNECAAENDVIIFPAGKYKVNSTLNMLETTKGVIGLGAVLFSENQLDPIMAFYQSTVQAQDRKHCVIRGMKFEGNNVCFSAILLGTQSIVQQCEFTGFRNCVIDCRGGLAHGQGCVIADCKLINHPSESGNSTIGIHLLSDSFVTDCVIWGMRSGIEYTANSECNRVSGCYFWNNNNAAGCYGISSIGAISPVEITDCYFDTMDFCTYDMIPMVSNCTVYINGPDSRNVFPKYLAGFSNTSLHFTKHVGTLNSIDFAGQFKNCNIFAGGTNINNENPPYTVAIETCNVAVGQFNLDGTEIRNNSCYRIFTLNGSKAMGLTTSEWKKIGEVKNNKTTTGTALDIQLYIYSAAKIEHLYISGTLTNCSYDGTNLTFGYSQIDPNTIGLYAKTNIDSESTKSIFIDSFTANGSNPELTIYAVAEETEDEVTEIG